MITHNKSNVKRILLSGGGTGGSVSPLLAISDFGFRISDFGNFEFLWLGTKNGPEKKMVSEENIKFKQIFSGKFRRYFSWRNFIDPFLVLIAFFQSLVILLVWRPDMVISAGSFVSVPVVWAAWILRVPVLIHQQDARPGLANKLMAPFARVITVTFEESLKYYGKKAVWTGNPARELRIKNYELRMKNKNNLPTVLIIGGGTGAVAINELIWESLDKLTEFCQIIHITGKNKRGSTSSLEVEPHGYQSFEFLNIEQMAEAYAAADIVVSRAGMGVLTELSYLGKPAILIPMPDSHQEDNAKIFKNKEAAIVLNQKELTLKKLTDNIHKLLDDEELRNKLRSNVQKVIKGGANEEIDKIINEIIK